jgi:outer membrane protein assembly factor BamD (BamD/ComL family)
MKYIVEVSVLMDMYVEAVDESTATAYVQEVLNNIQDTEHCTDVHILMTEAYGEKALL